MRAWSWLRRGGTPTSCLMRLIWFYGWIFRGIRNWVWEYILGWGWSFFELINYWRDIEKSECMLFLGFPLWEDLQAEWGHGEWSNNYKLMLHVIAIAWWLTKDISFDVDVVFYCNHIVHWNHASDPGVQCSWNHQRCKPSHQWTQVSTYFFGMYFHFMCLELVFIKLSQVDRSAVPVPIWRVHPLRATRLLALRHQTGFDFSEKCRNIPIVAFRRRTPSPAERGLLASPSCTWAGTSTLATSWWCLALFIHEFQSISVFIFRYNCAQFWCLRFSTSLTPLATMEAGKPLASATTGTLPCRCWSKSIRLD